MHLFHRWSKWDVVEHNKLHIYMDGEYERTKVWTTMAKRCTVCGDVKTKKVKGVHIDG